MIYLRHNILSKLYMIREKARTHSVRVLENRFQHAEERLAHAESIVNQTLGQLEHVIEILRNLGASVGHAVLKHQMQSRVPLRRLWRQVIRDIAEQYDLEQVDLVERIPHGFPFLRCSRNDFKEVLYCLVANAFEAMTEDARLVIRAELCCVSGCESMAMITLADEGTGISETALSSLFQPFYTTKPEGKGNGLGLCLARSLVVKNGGMITASSFEGRGTTFTLKFPVWPRKKKASKSHVSF